MTDYSEEYFAAERTVRLGVYTPALSSAISSMQTFGQQRIDYATSRMRAILDNMIAKPRRWESNPNLINLLDHEIVCPHVSPCRALSVLSTGRNTHVGGGADRQRGGIAIPPALPKLY